MRVQSIIDDMNRGIIKKTWMEIEERVKHISKQILERGFKPDCIVGIARGGLVPAVMLAYKLECRMLGFIQFQRTKDEKPFSLFNNSNLLYSVGLPRTSIKRVLLVDDIIVKGIIFKDAIAIIQHEYGPIEILGAFLYKVNNSGGENIETHSYIFSEAINGNDWIVYPWEQDPI